ncbi:hypothetical protein AAFF_G00402800, partial [Aldrovandia affinis]
SSGHHPFVGTGERGDFGLGLVLSGRWHGFSCVRGGNPQSTLAHLESEREKPGSVGPSPLHVAMVLLGDKAPAAGASH